MFHTETWFPSIQTVSQDPCKVEWLRGTGLRQASGGTARCLRTPSRTSTTSFTRMSVVSADSYSSISSGASTNGSTVSDRPPERRPAYEPSGTKWFERDGVRFGALLSGDGAHRFTLVREWNRARPRLLWIGLNPSTADAFTTDPSSRRVVQRARMDGFGRVDVGNLWSYRITHPAELPCVRTSTDETDDHLIGMIEAADTIVAGWGSTPVSTRALRIAQVLRLLNRNDLFAYGTTATYGDPEHPLSRKFVSGLPQPTLWLPAQAV